MTLPATPDRFPQPDPVMSVQLPSRSLSRAHLGLLLGFIGMAIFGGSLPATRVAVTAIDPLAVTALRSAIAGLCSLALLIVLRRPLPPRRLWFQLAIASLCVSILFPLLMAVAVQTVNASHGGVVMGALPIATTFVAVLITHERPQPLFWIASIAGAALVVAFALRQGGGALSSGDLLLFAAVAASAIGYVFSGRLTAQMPGWEVISWALVAALPVSLPAAMLTMPAELGHIEFKPWLALLYVALFSQWIGFFAWNAGMAMAGIAPCCSLRPWLLPSRSRRARGAGRAQRLGPDAAPRRRTYSAAETRANSVACRSNNPR
jgi:drug/metabolite transporter (DMT)-like permease